MQATPSLPAGCTGGIWRYSQYQLCLVGTSGKHTCTARPPTWFINQCCITPHIHTRTETPVRLLTGKATAAVPHHRTAQPQPGPLQQQLHCAANQVHYSSCCTVQHLERGGGVEGRQGAHTMGHCCCCWLVYSHSFALNSPNPGPAAPLVEQQSTGHLESSCSQVVL